MVAAVVDVVAEAAAAVVAATDTPVLTSDNLEGRAIAALFFAYCRTGVLSVQCQVEARISNSLTLYCLMLIIPSTLGGYINFGRVDTHAPRLVFGQ